MNRRSISNAIGNARAFQALSYILVFLMMLCGVMTSGSFIQNLSPGVHSGIIAGILLFVVIERLSTYQHLKSLTLLSSEWVIALGAQWIVTLVFGRLLLSYADGLEAFVSQMSLIAHGYMEILFTPEFLVTALLAILVWFLTGQFLELLDEIGLDHEVALREEPNPIRGELISAHQRLVELIFSIGLGLVTLTALASIDLRSIFTSPAGLPRLELNHLTGGEAGALLYFVFGFALLSLSRLMSLQTNWNRLGIPVSSKNLVRQWGVYSLFFLLLMAVIVSLLPAGDSLGFFYVVGTLFGFLFRVLVFISEAIVALVLFLFSLPFLLFGKAPSILTESSPPPFPTLPQQPAATTASSPAWVLIRSILLWGSLLGILIFAFVQFVRQHEGIRAVLIRSRLASWLTLAWQWLYKNAAKTRGTLSRAIVGGWQSVLSRLEGKRILPPSGLISLGMLSPRRRIYFFYLAMIRRGGEQGLTRQPSQTPSEYAVEIEKALPSAGKDIDSITDAFVEARYSRQEIDSNQADRVKATWARIRRALQSKVKSERSGENN